MIQVLLSLLIYLIVLGILYYAIQHAPLSEPFKTGAYLVLLLIFVIILLGLLMGQMPLVPIKG